MKPHNTKNSHKQARKQRGTGKYKIYIKTHHNIIYVQFQVTNNILYTLQAHTKHKGTNEHD
jgi:hypothetical protein